MTISIRELLKQKEFWAFLFILGMALLNWPLLSLAENESEIFGVPSVLAYITIVWLMIIALAYLFDRGYSG